VVVRPREALSGGSVKAVRQSALGLERRSAGARQGAESGVSQTEGAMSVETTLTIQDDLELVSGIFERLGADLGMILDREVALEDVRSERSVKRVSGEGQVHISFKIALQLGQETRHGCLLVPLPDAIALAAFLMMMPDETVALERGREELDRPMKEALLEVGNFVAGACDAVLRRMLPDAAARSEGCQGVRPGIRPAFPYQEGNELIVGRARARVHAFEPCELILMLPRLGE
jgi:hypothetical protein